MTLETLSNRGKLCGPLVIVALTLAWSATAQALPDGRGFERVTPLDKNATDIAGGAVVLDGDHVLGRSGASFLDNDPGFSASTAFLAVRGPTGWTAHSEVLGPTGTGLPIDVNNTFDRVLFDVGDPLLGDDVDSARDVYLRNAAGLRRVTTGSLGGNSSDGATYAGQSPDGTHIFFQSAESLEPKDAGRISGEQLYEWIDGKTRVVALDSNQKLIGTEGAVLGAGLTADGALGGAEGGAISADGSEVIFTSPPPIGSEASEVYLRIDGRDTLQLSTSRRSTPGNGEHRIKFQGTGVGPDGAFSRVIFSTSRQLTDGDNDVAAPDPGDIDGQDIYSYDLGTDELTRLTGGPNDTWQDASVSQVLGMSSDGERVYYIARGALVPGAIAGERNIYLYDGHSGGTRLVATLDPTDPGVAGPQGSTVPGLTDVTADGDAIVFGVTSRLTDFDNDSAHCGPDGQVAPCSEVYRYEASTDSLDCVSCNHDDRPPLGDSRFRRKERAVRGTWINHFVSDDGSLVAFETKDSLVPQDTNGQFDVYQWRDGVASLLTSGKSPNPATITGMTKDGRDIFFLAFDQLVYDDTDPYADLYDARVGGGFPPGAKVGRVCAEDACQGSPSPAPGFQAPGTSDVDGRGNTAATVRGRYVVRRPTKQQRATAARTGRLSLSVSVNRPGKIVTSARAKIGKRQARVGEGSTTAKKRGVVRVTLELSRAARRELATAGRLRLALSIRFSKALEGERMSLTLQTAGHTGR